MRVVSGRWRGRRLRAPQGTALRPTTDRVKEALFNILRDDVAGGVFVDLCCGAGGLGIEALSRGARRCLFIDRDPAALAAAGGNLAGCGADPGAFSLVRQDALDFLGQWLARPQEGAWVLVSDPPYAADLAGAILARMPELIAAAGCRAVAIEHSGRLDGPALAGGCGELRRYGRTALTIARPGDQGEDPHE